MGISCDPAGTALPPADRPPSDAGRRGPRNAGRRGAPLPANRRAPGAEPEDLAVTGELWWSASNWRNRITVPLTFAPPANVCDRRQLAEPVHDLRLGADDSRPPGSGRRTSASTASCSSSPRPDRGAPGQEPARRPAQSKRRSRAHRHRRRSNDPWCRRPLRSPASRSYSTSTTLGSRTGAPADARLLAKLLTESYPDDPSIQQDDAALRNP